LELLSFFRCVLGKLARGMLLYYLGEDSSRSLVQVSGGQSLTRAWLYDEFWAGGSRKGLNAIATSFNGTITAPVSRYWRYASEQICRHLVLKVSSKRSAHDHRVGDIHLLTETRELIFEILCHSNVNINFFIIFHD
jgi:hypothetical protein